MQRRRGLAGAALVLVVLVACSSPATAGNALWAFMGDVQAEEFRSAYERTCSSFKASMSYEEFADGGFATFAPPIELASVVGVSSRADNDVETMEGSVRTATRVIEGSRGTQRERWSVELVKEADGWKICAFEPLGPAS